MFSKFMFFFSVALALTGCGSGGGAGDGTLSGLAYVFTTKGTLTVGADGSITGTGIVSVLNPTPDQKQSYQFTFSLQDGGMVELIAAASTGLKNGDSARFSRSGTTLTVQGISPNGAVQDYSGGFVAGVDATAAMTFVVDVHNNETPTHMLIWGMPMPASFAEGNARANSESGGALTGNGAGKVWGFSLTNATLSAIATGAPKLAD